MLLSNFIVVTDYTHGRILQVDLQTGTVVKLPIIANKSPGLVFDKSTMMLFYCETLTKSIKYTTLQGENTTHFYTTGIQFKSFTLCNFLVWPVVFHRLLLYLNIFVYYWLRLMCSCFGCSKSRYLRVEEIYTSYAESLKPPIHPASMVTKIIT